MAVRKKKLPSAATLPEHLEAVKGQLLGEENRPGDPAAAARRAEPVAMLNHTLLVNAFDEPQLVKHARVIVERRLEGKTYKEIAKELDLTEYNMENSPPSRG